MAIESRVTWKYLQDRLQLKNKCHETIGTLLYLCPTYLKLIITHIYIYKI